MKMNSMLRDRGSDNSSKMRLENSTKEYTTSNVLTPIEKLLFIKKKKNRNLQ